MQMPNEQPARGDKQPKLDQPVDFAALHGWDDDDHAAAFSTFCRSAPRVLDPTYAVKGALIDLQCLKNTAQKALEAGPLSRRDAKAFFEDNFDPHALGSTDRFEGFVTGYFEPELSASRSASDEFPIPLYRPPNDLADHAEAHQVYPLDRAAIEAGALAGRGLELVWLNNKTDAYFIHVQGSARLLLDDGAIMRVSFAAKTGHPYTSLGKALSERLDMPPEQMTADVLADWMRKNPTELDAFTAQNRSFIFFDEVKNLDANDGPIGAAGASLVPGRSLAVDQSLHSYGVPIWLSTPGAVLEGNNGPNRLMIAQDTGSAITGIQRGDIYVGSGEAAGQIAGRIQSPARMVVLVPKP